MPADRDGRGRDRQINRRLGARVKARREALGMSQEALARRLGVTFQQVQRYENGINAVAWSRIEALCKALDISPDELFEWRTGPQR